MKNQNFILNQTLLNRLCLESVKLDINQISFMTHPNLVTDGKV